MRTGFVFGFVAFGATLYWIASALSIVTRLAILGYLATVFLHAVVAGFMAVTLLFARRATRWPLAILLPLVWVTMELFVEHLHDIRFPWLPLGLATSSHPILAQTAELSGVHGVSFWIAATNGLIADAFLLRASLRKALVRGGAAVALALAIVSYGAWRLRTLTLSPLAPIAVVQPNVPERDRIRPAHPERFIDALAKLTRTELAAGSPRMVVWPEVALPARLSDHPEWSDSLTTLVSSGGAPILFGVIDVRPDNAGVLQVYNAARVTETDGSVSQPPYQKSFLVPVVERVPFLNPRWFGGSIFLGIFGRGENLRPFVLPFGRVGALICYESIFPSLSRRQRQLGATLMVNITNDAWFGRSIAPHQHFAHLALRAIENRVGIIRAANTGISAYIDPLGRVHGETQLFVTAARTYQADASSVNTAYVRFGDWMGWGSALATLGFLVAYWFRRPRASTIPRPAR